VARSTYRIGQKTAKHRPTNRRLQAFNQVPLHTRAQAKARPPSHGREYVRNGTWFHLFVRLSALLGCPAPLARKRRSASGAKTAECLWRENGESKETILPFRGMILHSAKFFSSQCGTNIMSEIYQKSFPVSWEELHRTSKALAWRLLEIGPFEGIVAVTRGGLVPAAIVARELEIRLIETACISSYHGKDQGGLEVLKSADLAKDGKGWLIVDDLVDTGETSKALRAMIPNAHFATVYAKPAGRPLVDTFVTEVSQDTWIFFPWDMEPQPSTPIIGQRA